jgi:hypothetical protein
MNADRWIERTLGLEGMKTELQEEEIVLQLIGKNVVGERIFSYVEIRLSLLQELKSVMQSGSGVNPRSFGRLMVEAIGKPSTQVIEEIERDFPMTRVYPPSK